MRQLTANVGATIFNQVIVLHSRLTRLFESQPFINQLVALNYLQLFNQNTNNEFNTQLHK